MAKREVSKEAKTAAPSAPPATHSPFDTLRHEIDRVFDDVTRGWPSMNSLWPPRKAWQTAFRNFDVMPHVDTSEDDKTYEISIELPGVEEKDVTLTVDNGMLTVRGEKKSQREEKKKEYHLTERSYGSFERSFQVPVNVDEAKIAASYATGVLTVVMPKSSNGKPSERRIPIGTKGK